MASSSSNVSTSVKDNLENSIEVPVTNLDDLPLKDSIKTLNLTPEQLEAIDKAFAFVQHQQEQNNNDSKEECSILTDPYAYSYDKTIAGVPMLSRVPFGELPSWAWFKLVVKQIVQIGFAAEEQKLVTLINTLTSNFKALFKLLPSYLRPGVTETEDKYVELFNPPLVLPRSAEIYKFQQSFPYWRLAGPNPMTIARCNESIDDLLRLMPGLTLDENSDTRQVVIDLLQRRRLYWVNYSIMNIFNPADDNGVDRFIASPIALFENPMTAVDHNSLVPICMQCVTRRNDSEPIPFICKPSDTNNWMLCMNIFNSVDADYHEIVEHLSHCHLTVEAFIPATHTKLSETHPLRILLTAHFEGTAFINGAAMIALVTDNGPVSQIASQKISELRNLSAQSTLARLGNLMSPEENIIMRGMDADNFFGPYPYRDDGMLVWDAIKSFVEGFLSVVYGAADDTRQQSLLLDLELQNWLEELLNAGKVDWLQGKINNKIISFDQLVHMVSFFIWTGSAQHAAVNFPQADIMAFAPAFSLGLYQASSQQQQPDINPQLAVISQLPPIDKATTQRDVTLLLGGPHYTQLGQYKSGLFQYPSLNAEIQKFQNNLQSIEEQIKSNNKERIRVAQNNLDAENQSLAKDWVYEYLLPSNIPQSINI